VEGSRPPVKETIEFARIVAFTDGVFAIAITILVLGIDVPEELPGPDIHDFLVDEWPQLFAYFLSFAVIGRHWVAHHHVFGMLHNFDQRLMALNLVYLSLVVLIPFPTNLLGEYGSEPDPIALYAFVIATSALLSWVMLRYALARQHIHPDSVPEAHEASLAALQPALVFYASIPIAFVSPLAAQLSWLMLPVVGLRARRARRT
jgi:TMEM175 potassium channel family protein